MKISSKQGRLGQYVITSYSIHYTKLYDERFDEVILAMKEVVERGGYGTSVTPVSQFYWQQAYANVMFGPWKQIAPGYGRMVLGYFGKTPVEADPEIIKLAGEKLKLEPRITSYNVCYTKLLRIGQLLCFRMH